MFFEGIEKDVTIDDLVPCDDNGRYLATSGSWHA